MIVKLSLEEYKILNELLNKVDSIRKKMLVSNFENYILIEVNEYIADNIREIALDELETVGFDINYELTYKGRIIEKIIDLFFVE